MEASKELSNTARIGGEHFTQAVATHGHAVQLGQEAERLREQSRFDEARVVDERARCHFETARSAAAIASAGLAAGAIEEVAGKLLAVGA